MAALDPILTPTPPVDPAAGRRRRLAVVLTAAATVLWIDQVTKAWAFRSLPHVQIDSGGGFFVSEPWGSAWSDPVVGPVLDVSGLAVLVAVTVLVTRRRRSPLVLTGAALAIAGWGSNLLDRLGLHSVTAPGSRRGVVDFFVWHGRIWNVADGTIALGLTLFAAGLVWQLCRALTKPRPASAYEQWRQPWAAPPATRSMPSGQPPSVPSETALSVASRPATLNRSA